MSAPVTLLVNPAAGGGRALKVLPGVQARLSAAGIEQDVRSTNSLDHGRALAREAAAAGRTVVTLSGDGLVGAVAGALAGVDGAVMGVLPGGRGNDFARVAGIPPDAVEACEVIVDGVVRPVDLGEVDGSPFIGIASLGFDSDANRIANAASARLGNLVYAYGALRALVSWTPAAFTVTVDGEEHTFSGWSVAAANSKAYGGGMFLAPDADLHDGKLDVVFEAHCSRLRFLRILPMLFKGTHVEQPEITVLRGREVSVEADRPFTVYADGDPIGELPATIRCRPGAVSVLLPPESSVAR
ncbi:diacylglycerol kinase family lipid kinase [Paraconexibacter antarcticus]|uniref:Diacylglycerol kinase family lipid kinase n=1 Tax=Paraconexibacter antarcticus TaxID=2949664 RepID=A0ABY5DMK2_9ACTN|nr:diacylglycerol kinase family protein [Paraconexibacter antarcticus]UTI62816.1 diacylglycerol kinase family lipid kinase [Paraconexibacter antarcticus]